MCPTIIRLVTVFIGTIAFFICLLLLAAVAIIILVATGIL